MAAFVEERKGPKLKSTFEDLLKSSEELATLLRSDAARWSASANGSSLIGDTNGAEDSAASLADHLRRVLQKRRLLDNSGISNFWRCRYTIAWSEQNIKMHVAAAGARELINRELDASLPQLQVCRKNGLLENSVTSAVSMYHMKD